MTDETAVAVEQLLRQRGVRVTTQRVAGLRAVSRRPHSTADDIDEAEVIYRGRRPGRVAAASAAAVPVPASPNPEHP